MPSPGKAVPPARVSRPPPVLAGRSYSVSAKVVREALRRKALVRARLAVAVAARANSRTRRNAARLIVYLRARRAAKRPSGSTKTGDDTPAKTTTKPATKTTTIPGNGAGTKTVRSPVTAGCDVGFGAFASPSAIPGACWRPYSDDSPFNQQLPASPRLAANSAAIVNTVTGWGTPADLPAGTTSSSGDWNHPVYYSSASDPVFTVHCTEDWGTCEVEGLKVHVPDAARAASSSDAHMAVVDQENNW